MATYNYIVKDKKGDTLKGKVEAASETEAVEILHRQDLIIVNIDLAKKKIAHTTGKSKVKLDDLVIFSRQLATMIDAAIPLVQCLNILSEQIENTRLKNVVSSLRKDIEEGMSFCAALSRHPDIFSNLYVSMVKAGEASGMLNDVLERLATYLEKTASLNRKIRSSLVYPAVVVSIALLITAVLLLKVVPTFKGIFDTLGSKLPVPTLILIAISDFFRKGFLLIIFLIIALSWIFKKYIGTEKGRYNFDKLKLKLPVLGELFRKVALAKFARTFSTLVKSGVSVLNALEIVATTSGNKIIEETVLNCQTAVRQGEQISKPLLKSGVFPLMVCRMIGVGEQTGELEKMLTKIADFYDDQVDAAVAGLTSMIEPIVIVFLGVMIGGIVIALFLPIFKITEIIGK